MILKIPVIGGVGVGVGVGELKTLLIMKLAASRLKVLTDELRKEIDKENKAADA